VFYFTHLLLSWGLLKPFVDKIERFGGKIGQEGTNSELEWQGLWTGSTPVVEGDDGGLGLARGGGLDGLMAVFGLFGLAKFEILI
jgi:hypothetical protein